MDDWKLYRCHGGWRIYFKIGFMKTVIPDVSIRAISSWLPERKIEMASLVEEYGINEVSSIIKATGVERVRIAEDSMTSSDMCYYAAQDLLEKEGMSTEDVDGLIFVSQTCDYILPSTSVILQDRLGLKNETVCIDIHYGCSGYIYGLLQAASWINCGICNNVMILAGDTTSKMINPKDKSLRMVFGDCGTATIVGKGNCMMGFHIQSDGSGYDRLIVPAGGFRQPKSANTSILQYDADNNGRTLDDLFMDGIAIFNFAISKVHKNINELIEFVSWEKEEVGLFLLHQANDFMVNYVRKKLKVEAEIVPTNVRDYGNTGPATLPLLCSDILPDSRYDLSKVIFSGFGVGLSWGSVATSLESTHFYQPKNK